MNPTPLGWCIFTPAGSFDNAEYRVFIYEYRINGTVEYTRDYTNYPLRTGRDSREIAMFGILVDDQKNLPFPSSTYEVNIVDEDRLQGRTESFTFFMQKFEPTILSEINMVNGLVDAQQTRVTITGVLTDDLFWRGPTKPEVVTEAKRELML